MTKAGFDGRRIRVVIDTNTLVSGILFPVSVPAAALRRARNACVILISQAVLAEISDVLSREKFDRYFSLVDRLSVFHLILHDAVSIEATEAVTACRDPRDDKFLSLAVSGRASIVGTGDKDLLALHPFGATSILTPAEFL